MRRLLTRPAAVLVGAVLLAVPGPASAHLKPGGGSTGRIIGGAEVSEPAPWAAAVGWSSPGMCSGSVVAPQWVLSAKHCMLPGPGKMTVAVGNADRGAGELIEVAEKHSRHDLLLLKLVRPAANATPVMLADADPPVGAENFIFGWGRTGRGVELGQMLKVATVKVTRLDARDNKNGPAIESSRGNGSAAQGDSGGPQFFNGAQVGVCSQGHVERGIQMYSSIAQSRDWIRTTAGV